MCCARIVTIDGHPRDRHPLTNRSGCKNSVPRTSQAGCFGGSICQYGDPRCRSNQWASRDAISRSQASEPLASNEHWKTLAKRFQVDVRTFPSQTKQSTDGTNLSEVLSQVIDSESRVQAVVLARMVIGNQGVSPVDVAMRYRTQNVPIFSIPIGSVTDYPIWNCLVWMHRRSESQQGGSCAVYRRVALPREHVVTVSFESSMGKANQRGSYRCDEQNGGLVCLGSQRTGGLFGIRFAAPHPDELL